MLFPNEQTFLSIIIPVYNVESFLKRCIESILIQDYKNYEIILIDDGSTDSSYSICCNYSKHYQNIKVYHQKNSGVSNARNKGLKYAKGKWVTFIDSDDYIENNSFKYITSLLTNDIDILISGGYLLKNKKTIFTDKLELYTANNILESLFYEKIPASLCLCFYKKELFSDIRLSTNIHFYEDWETQYRLFSKANKILKSQYRYYNYYQREDSINHINVGNKHLSCLQIADNLKDNISTLTNDNYINIRSFFIYKCVFHLFRDNKPDNNILKLIEKEINTNQKVIKRATNISVIKKIIILLGGKSMKKVHLYFSRFFRIYLFIKINYLCPKLQ